MHDRLLTEVYTFLNGYSTDNLNELFHIRHNVYNLQNFHTFINDVPKHNYFLNFVAYRTNQLWVAFPFDLKNSYLLENVQECQMFISNLLKFFSWSKMYLIVYTFNVFFDKFCQFFFVSFFQDTICMLRSYILVPNCRGRSKISGALMKFG